MERLKKVKYPLTELWDGEDWITIWKENKDISQGIMVTILEPSSCCESAPDVVQLREVTFRNPLIPRSFCTGGGVISVFAYKSGLT